MAGLRREFAGSAHVRDVDLQAASDTQIWDYAKAQGLAIVSKDTDFRERSFVEGFPPKIAGIQGIATAAIFGNVVIHLLVAVFSFVALTRQ